MLNIFTRPISFNKREALDPNFPFNAGQWVKILNGKASLANPTDTGLEQVYMGNIQILRGNLRTVYGLYEGWTDQYVKTSTYTVDCNLTVREGLLDLAASKEAVFATCVDIPSETNPGIRFKRIM
jgi:hypothetical protein